MEKKFMYSNSTSMGMTQYDISIKFDLIQGEAGLSENDFRVVLSPNHAKAVMEALIVTVSQYESMFGLIPAALTPEKLQEVVGKGIIDTSGIKQ